MPTPSSLHRMQGKENNGPEECLNLFYLNSKGEARCYILLQFDWATGIFLTAAYIDLHACFGVLPDLLLGLNDIREDKSQHFPGVSLAIEFEVA